MKKKLTAVALVVCMLAIMLVGASLAYFTDDEYVQNTMTVGKVDIEQSEVVDDETAMVPMADDLGIELNNKVVTVKVTEDSQKAYVRTLVAFEHNDPNGDGKFADGIAWKVHFSYNDECVPTYFSNNVLDNVKIGESYYSLVVLTVPEAMDANTEIDTLLGVWFDKAVTNEDVSEERIGEKYDILVLSQAVQADGWAEGATAQDAFDATFELTEANVQKWFTEAAAE